MDQGLSRKHTSKSRRRVRRLLSCDTAGVRRPAQGRHHCVARALSGSNVELLYKAPGDKMFGLQAGFRNDLLDKETGVSKLRPYVGASIYFRLDKDRD